MGFLMKTEEHGTLVIRAITVTWKKRGQVLPQCA